MTVNGNWRIIATAITILGMASGWAYSAGTLSAQVKNNTKELEKNTVIINNIPAIMNEVNNLSKNQGELIKQQKEMSKQQAVNTETLKRIEDKLD